jgi:hypothetical protein
VKSVAAKVGVSPDTVRRAEKPRPPSYFQTAISEFSHLLALLEEWVGNAQELRSDPRFRGIRGRASRWLPERVSMLEEATRKSTAGLPVVAPIVDDLAAHPRSMTTVERRLLESFEDVFLRLRAVVDKGPFRP